MTFYPNDPSARNRASAANRLPIPDPVLLDRHTRLIASKYNVSPGMARIVAEMVGASMEARQ
jgi:hypothetical protein